MTKQQIIHFAKAPFSRSFGIVYILTLINFLLIPLLSDLVHFLSKNYEILEKMQSDKIMAFFINSFIPTLSINHVLMAVIGFCVSIIFLSGYKIGLIHKVIAEKNDIFETSKIQLSFPFISLSIIKYILASLTCCCLFILPILILGGFVTIGIYIGETLKLTILSICVGIVGFISFFILLYKLICYFFTANLFFLSTLKISSLINYKKVTNFFKDNRNNIFIAFLLAYVGGEMLSVLLASFISKILEVSLIAGTISSMLDLGCYWILALTLLVFNFLWTYVSLLHGIIYGKIVLWLNKSIQKHT